MATTRKIQVDADTEFIFPTDNGEADQALITNGAGTLSWGTVAAESSGGGTGKNYISNPSGNDGSTGWAAYGDAASETPADGDGGSPTLTVAGNTTTPLSGAGDILITKDAANRQGEGVVTAFTIDNADKGQKLLISFDYTTSANYADDDVGIFIYDVSNTSLTRVNGEGLKAVSGTGKHYAQFQAASDSTSYRLIFHVASTSASAYTINLDTVSVGPSKITHGAVITDWKSYTPTGSWTGDVTYEGRYRRAGDSIEIEAQVRLTGGSISGGDLSWTAAQLFNGLSIDVDTSKLINDADEVEAVGVGIYEDHGLFQRGALSLFYQPSGAIFSLAGATFSNLTTGGTPITWASGDSISFRGTIPIAGWSANTQTSQDYSGRDVVCTARGLTGEQTITKSTVTKVTNFNTPAVDTTNSWDSSNDYFVVPETGYYDAHMRGHIHNESDGTIGLDTVTMWIQIDGVDTYPGIEKFDMEASGFGASVNATAMYLTKGQQVSFAVYYHGDGNLDTTNTLYDAAAYTNFSIAKRSSAQTVLNTGDPIICTVRGLSGTHATNSGDWYQIENYNTPEIDTTNSWDSANDKYVVPETGYYDISISGKIEDEATAYNMGACLVAYYVNGVQGPYFGQNYDNENTTVTTGAGRQLSGTVSVFAVPFNKGDEIEIWIYYQGGDASNTVTTGGQYTWFQIAKRGAANTYINTDRKVACRVSKDDVQSIGNATTVPIRYDDITYDTHGAYHLTDDKYTVPVTGYYEIYAKMRYQDLDEQAGDNYQMYILVGGVNKSQISDEAGATNTTSRSLQIQDTLLLNKGEEVTIACYQATGGAEGTMAQATDMVFTIRKI